MEINFPSLPFEVKVNEWTRKASTPAAFSPRIVSLGRCGSPLTELSEIQRIYRRYSILVSYLLRPITSGLGSHRAFIHARAREIAVTISHLFVRARKSAAEGNLLGLKGRRRVIVLRACFFTCVFDRTSRSGSIPRLARDSLLRIAAEPAVEKLRYVDKYPRIWATGTRSATRSAAWS